jgi:hypothetical protein
MIEIPPDICRKTVAQYEKHDSGRGSADWPPTFGCSIGSIQATGRNRRDRPAALREREGDVASARISHGCRWSKGMAGSRCLMYDPRGIAAHCQS